MTRYECPNDNRYIDQTAGVAYVHAPTGATVSYANDDLNRVTSAGGTGVAYTSDQQIWYGNGQTQAYDTRGNLDAVTAGGVATTYLADARGLMHRSDSGGNVNRLTLPRHGPRRPPRARPSVALPLGKGVLSLSTAVRAPLAR